MGDKNSLEWTALHHAILRYNNKPTPICMEKIKQLLLYGANMDIKDDNGYTPMQMACFYYLTKIIKIFKDEIERRDKL